MARSVRCYLYVLPLAYEDILKVGISVDPLARARAFSRRYYDCFDLSRSLLVEFDSRREAQARETSLHRQLREWNAPHPITMPTRAGGAREWYRGAYAQLVSEIAQDHQGGRSVHGLEWWRSRLAAEREALFEWGWQWQCHVDAESPTSEQLTLLVDTLDAWTAFGLDIELAVPSETMRHYASHRSDRSLD